MVFKSHSTDGNTNNIGFCKHTIGGDRQTSPLLFRAFSWLTVSVNHQPQQVNRSKQNLLQNSCGGGDSVGYTATRATWLTRAKKNVANNDKFISEDGKEGTHKKRRKKERGNDYSDFNSHSRNIKPTIVVELKKKNKQKNCWPSFQLHSPDRHSHDSDFFVYDDSARPYSITMHK